VTAIATQDTDLQTAVRALAERRRDLEATEASLGAAWEEFKAANAELYARREAEAVALSNADAVVRMLALKEFERLNIKKLTTGVEIKTTKKFAIDETAGLAWAKQHGMLVLPESLDVAGAKKMAGVTPLPFVTVTEAPTVFIASDLSALLENTGGAA